MLMYMSFILHIKKGIEFSCFRIYVHRINLIQNLCISRWDKKQSYALQYAACIFYVPKLFPSIKQIQFNSNSIQIQFKFNWNSIQIQFKFNSSQIQFKFNSNSIQIQFKFNSNSIQIQIPNIKQIQFKINSI